MEFTEPTEKQLFLINGLINLHTEVTARLLNITPDLITGLEGDN